MSTTIINAPSQNTIVFDANDTIIDIASGLGSDYYYVIQFTDETGLEKYQSWSRKDGINASIDITNFYRNIFVHPFELRTSFGIVRRPELMRKLQIGVFEALIEDDQTQNIKPLDPFYVHESFYPTQIESNSITSDTLQWLDGIPERSIFPKNGVIRLPFLFTPSSSESLNFEMKVLYNTEQLASSIGVISEIGSYDAIVNLNAINLGLREYIEVRVQIGTEVISRKIVLKPWTLYATNEIVFKNNFGHWQHAYFFGKKKEQGRYSRAQYTLQNDTTQTFEIKKEVQLTVNTGYLDNDQIQIVDMICMSKEILVKIKTRYVPVTFSTKRSALSASLEHVYNEDLIFTVKGSQL